MGKKKREDPENGSLFKSLFGDLPKGDASSNSLFSDSNPFRRKPTPSVPTVPFENPNIQDSELKKRKRNKETNNTSQTLEDSPITPLSVEPKKSKKDRQRNPNLGSESHLEVLNSVSESKEMSKKEKGKHPVSGSEQNPNSGSEVKEKAVLDKGKEKKKKRKRDEIEEVYEAQHYGGVTKVEAVGEKRKTLDNPAEMLVSKEGFDDESKLLRTVFVGNLQLKIKKKVLLKEFSMFGEVESVRIRSVPVLDVGLLLTCIYVG